MSDIEAESSTAAVRHNNVPYNAEHPFDLNDFTEKQQVNSCEIQFIV